MHPLFSLSISHLFLYETITGNENFEAAMSSYVNAILTGSEYCTVNLDQNIDDYIVRRMIKCCSNLGCFMQAAVLCQVRTIFLIIPIDF